MQQILHIERRRKNPRFWGYRDRWRMGGKKRKELSTKSYAETAQNPNIQMRNQLLQYQTASDAESEQKLSFHLSNSSNRFRKGILQCRTAVDT